jgi:hypothetical protein
MFTYDHRFDITSMFYFWRAIITHMRSTKNPRYPFIVLKEHLPLHIEILLLNTYIILYQGRYFGYNVNDDEICFRKSSSLERSSVTIA